MGGAGAGTMTLEQREKALIADLAAGWRAEKRAVENQSKDKASDEPPGPGGRDDD